MTPTIITRNEKINRTMPIWVDVPPDSRMARIAPGNQTEPLYRPVQMTDRIVVVELTKKADGPRAHAIQYLTQPVEIQPARLSLAPFAPKEHIPTVAQAAKPSNVYGLQTNGPVAIIVTAQAGFVGRRSRPPGGELKPQHATIREQGVQGVQKGYWSAEALRPPGLEAGQSISIPLSPQVGTGQIRRPRQALRELALPSPRPWQSLTLPWQSFAGFCVALPPIADSTTTIVQTPPPAKLWNSSPDVYLPGHLFLRESGEVLREQKASMGGARIGLAEVEPVPGTAPFSVGLRSAFQNAQPVVGGQEPRGRTIPEELPPPALAITPGPDVAFTSGFLIWAGVTNSYVNRSQCAPKLHGGNRLVHALRLAPTKKLRDAVA